MVNKYNIEKTKRVIINKIKKTNENNKFFIDFPPKKAHYWDDSLVGEWKRRHPKACKA
jgi:hypothetical protein